MLGTNQKKKQGVLRGCLIPIASLIGFIAGCYLLCSGLFVLNGGKLSFASAQPTAVATPGALPEENLDPTPSGPGGLLYLSPSTSGDRQAPLALALTVSWR